MCDRGGVKLKYSALLLCQPRVVILSGLGSDKVQGPISRGILKYKLTEGEGAGCSGQAVHTVQRHQIIKEYGIFTILYA